MYVERGSKQKVKSETELVFVYKTGDHGSSEMGRDQAY